MIFYAVELSLVKEVDEVVLTCASTWLTLGYESYGSDTFCYLIICGGADCLACVFV